MLFSLFKLPRFDLPLIVFAYSQGDIPPVDETRRTTNAAVRVNLGAYSILLAPALDRADRTTRIPGAVTGKR